MHTPDAVSLPVQLYLPFSVGVPLRWDGRFHLARCQCSCLHLVAEEMSIVGHGDYSRQVVAHSHRRLEAVREEREVRGEASPP
jgi:hypothetical protein